MLESYTSILPGIEKERLEKLYGKDVEIAYREKVEEDIEEVSLSGATHLGFMAFFSFFFDLCFSPPPPQK